MTQELTPLNPSQATAPAPLAAWEELTPTEQEQARSLAAQLEAGSLQAILAFGRELGTEACAQADRLLEQVRPQNLELVGSRLGEIVSVARGLNLQALSDNRSRLPFIGGLIDRLRLKGGDLLSQFQDVRTQLEALIAEVEGMQSGLAQRVESLEQAFASVRLEHRLLGVHLAAGESVLLKLSQRREQETLGAAGNPLRAQDLQDLIAAQAALEKRVADLRMLQQTALQQLPMIRMVQANNRMLIEKFHTIKELTVPAWKRQFMLALSLQEQKNAVQLADTIDNATNDFLKENARLLKDNTLSTARANQRMVIDVATLQEVHDTLMSTVQEVTQIHQEGMQQRNSASARLLAMRQQLARQLSAA